VIGMVAFDVAIDRYEQLRIQTDPSESSDRSPGALGPTFIRYSVKQNGYLMSTFAIVRATFLTFAFPSIISFGRKWYESKRTPRSTGNPGSSASSISGQKPGFRRGVSYSYTSSRPTRDEEDETSSDESDEDETGEYKGHGKESEHHSAFDLDFLRWSCLFDAVGTAVMAFSSKSWQMYIGE
jgi:hypothetical protein